MLGNAGSFDLAADKNEDAADQKRSTKPRIIEKKFAHRICAPKDHLPPVQTLFQVRKFRHIDWAEQFFDCRNDGREKRQEASGVLNAIGLLDFGGARLAEIGHGCGNGATNTVRQRALDVLPVCDRYGSA
jgi:hypothetical protein